MCPAAVEKPAGGRAVMPGAGFASRSMNWLLAAGLALLLAGGTARAGDPPALAEHQIKALYLFNFIKYVEWPASSFASTNAPYIVGIVQAGRLGDDLGELTKARRINGREIVVKVVLDPQAARTCQVLFLGAGEDQHTRQKMLEAVGGLPVLTVEDREDSADGAGVRFLRQDDNLRPEINLAAVRRANLTVSPKLLAVAIVVRQPAEYAHQLK
jgi:hypothetical protein